MIESNVTLESAGRELPEQEEMYQYIEVLAWNNHIDRSEAHVLHARRREIERQRSQRLPTGKNGSRII